MRVWTVSGSGGRCLAEPVLSSKYWLIWVTKGERWTVVYDYCLILPVKTRIVILKI